MNEPKTVMADTPREAVRENTKAKIPIGANSMIHVMITNIADLIALKTSTITLRCFSSIRRSATANKPVKINNGRTALSAAAANGLSGINETNHSLKGGNSFAALASYPVDSNRLALL